MTLDALLSCFPGLPNERQGALLKQFQLLEDIPGIFYAIVVAEEGKYRFDYTSTSIEELTGYPITNFTYRDGLAFFYTITPPQYRKSILDQELSWLQEARKNDLDPTAPFIININGALEHSCKRIMDVRLSALILEFTRERVPKSVIDVWQVVDGLGEQAVADLKHDVEERLTGIWQFCNKPQSCIKDKPGVDDPIQLSYPLYEYEALTKREFNVLRLLANGLTTSEISQELRITDNTTETYRRHLLEKFKAVNAAEMIKKASKVYWLE